MSFKSTAPKSAHYRINTPDTAPTKTLRTNQLLRNPTNPNLAELGWRFGLAIAAFNLVLLAIVVSATNPRAGRGFGLVFALLAFLVYYNMLNIGFGWVSSGRVGFTNWMLVLHGGVFAATLAWLVVRSNQWSWRHLMPRRV